jgi:hypothetical protein
MDEDVLKRFLLSVAGNPKILASHISLFSAILGSKKKELNEFNISRRKLMAVSKLKSPATYHKCIKDLIKFKIINYIPSFHPKLGSIIVIKI